MLVIKDKVKFTRGIIIIITGFALFIGVLYFCASTVISLFSKEGEEILMNDIIENNNVTEQTEQISENISNYSIDEWNLKLVNKTYSVDKTYIPELEEISDEKMFDKRAISYLKNMLEDIRKENITNIWVQSAYRSYEKQEELFENKVNYYIEQGKNQEEAESLAQTIVQRPEMSEHNLGLAVDFNTVTNEFEKTKAFEWLQENAQNYGFILRYPKDKQDITGITYESWHWRYVGIEHAKIIKQKGYCLEEYIKYLQEAQEV